MSQKVHRQQSQRDSYLVVSFLSSFIQLSIIIILEIVIIVVTTTFVDGENISFDASLVA
jgi:hypothetical protein